MANLMFDDLKELKIKMKEKELGKKSIEVEDDQKSKEKKLQEDFEKYLKNCEVKKI